MRKKKSRRAWTSPESAIARARDDLGPYWFKRITSVGLSESANEWVERLPVVVEMGREWFESQHYWGPFDLGTYFEMQRVAYRRMCRLAEKVEALEASVSEIRDLAAGALATVYEYPPDPDEAGTSEHVEDAERESSETDEPHSTEKKAERQKRLQPRTYEITDEVGEFVEEYDWIREKTRVAATHARSALRELPAQGPVQLVARLRGQTGRRAWSTLSRDEIQRVDGLLVPRRSDLVRAVFERWPDARRIATSTWAYFGIGMKIDAVPRTAEEWAAVRAAWGTELRRARRPLKAR